MAGEGEKPIRFIETAPDVWKVAPESQEAMDDKIEAALAKAGFPSLDELRKDFGR